MNNQSISSQAERDYWTAAAQSFKWQVKTRVVPVSSNTVTEIPLGFQPFGISALGDRVLLTDYFAPAVCMNRVTVDSGVLKFEVAWIHGALNGITRCRGGFPDMAYPSGANRCVTAFFAPDGKSVCVGRIDREFFLLTPQENAQWRITGKITLPEDKDFPFVHSATVHGRGSYLETVESDAACGEWRCAQYAAGNATGEWGECSTTLCKLCSEKSPRFQYGIAVLGVSSVLVASSHSIRGENATAAGIYVRGRLVVPGIIGSGICILPNGGTLVAQYGQEEEGSHKGKPGALTYVPPALLSPPEPPPVAA